MNGLVTLASKLFEAAAASHVSLEESELANIELGSALEDDRYAKELASASLDQDDVESMSPWAWIRYLKWRASQASTMPSLLFLEELFQIAEDPLCRMTIAAALLRFEASDDSWLSVRLLLRSDERLGPMLDDAEAIGLELAGYLLDIGTEESLSLFRSTLQRSALRRDDLIQLAIGYIAWLDEDDEQRLRFLRHVGLADRD